MPMFWLAFWGALAGMAFVTIVLVAAMPWIGKVLLNALTDRLTTSLVDTKYTLNLGSMLNLLRRADPQVFLENVMRATKTQAISRPMGTPKVFSHWEHLIFNPAQLKRMPTQDPHHIDTRIVIGPKAQKPLKVDIPILITGMSYGGALSAKTKVALALGANGAGTATNTGENYLPAERDAAKKLIVQYHRGDWPNSAQNHPEWLESADAIEIQIGQGAQAAAEMKQAARVVTDQMREVMGLKPDQDALIRTRLKGVNSAAEFADLVGRLKEQYPIPVGVKLAPSGRLIDDLDILIQAQPDFITLDGGEGGTHGGPPILQDDFGLPLMAAIHWTDQYLKEHGVRHRISIIAAGGLRTPGNFLKAIAIGADGVYIGFAALMAMAASQARHVLPWAPPGALFYETGPSRNRLNVDQAARGLTNFLLSCTDELKQAVVALGLESVRQVSRDDLIALDNGVAEMAGVPSIVRSQTQPPWMETSPERPQAQTTSPH